MKFCVGYSETHSVFLKDFFLKTFPFEEDVTLIVEKLPQKCASGALFSKGWREQMIEKQKFINKCLSFFRDGEMVVFSDVDVRFYQKSIRNDLSYFLGANDICFMKDHNSDETGRCGGFFVLRTSEKTRSFFGEVLHKLLSHKDTPVSFETSEQAAINNLLQRRPDISWGYLPEKYYTHGLYTQGIKNFSEKNQSGLWWENKDHEEKTNIYVPSDILVHHANWCHGVENKINLLNWVNEKLTFRKKRELKEKVKGVKSSRRKKAGGG